jgi:MATE family, multidrug efflux pump
MIQQVDSMPSRLGAIPIAAPKPVSSAKAARTRQLLEGGIVPTLFRLAAPNVLNLVALSLIVTADAFFVGRLGAEALAGVSLVFPLKMLMQHMAASGMGGAVASAIARALGAGRREDADALVVHAIGIALGMAALFTVGVLALGPGLYRALGGRDAALDAAIAYSTVVFAGALTPWLFNTLASVLRGAGSMGLPAAAICGVAVADFVLSPLLIFGYGPVPRLGIVGAGLGFVTSFGIGSLVLGVYLAAGRSLVRLSLRTGRLDRKLLADILKVGIPGSLNPVFNNLTVVLMTGLSAGLGSAALAGYGLAARVEYIVIPLVFGFGTALVTMVATNSGAGQVKRAERIGWIGAGIIAVGALTIGLAGAAAPELWMGLFTADPGVRSAGATYLRIVGPCYGFYGLGLALYFASQGFGGVTWPVLANGVRLLVAVGAGWAMIHWYDGGLAGLSAAIAAAFAVYCGINVGAIKGGAWGTGRQEQANR